MNKKLLAQNKALQAEHERLKTEVFVTQQHQNTLENSLNILYAVEEATKIEWNTLNKVYKEAEESYRQERKALTAKSQDLRDIEYSYKDRLNSIYSKTTDCRKQIERGVVYV